MLPYQERVVQERAELVDRLQKLTNFIESNPIYPTLNLIDQSLMVTQQCVMTMLINVLGTRIEYFDKEK